MNTAQPSAALKQLLGDNHPKEGMIRVSAEHGIVTLRLPVAGDFLGFQAHEARELGLAFISCAAQIDYANELSLQGSTVDLGKILGKVNVQPVPAENTSTELEGGMVGQQAQQAGNDAQAQGEGRTINAPGSQTAQ